MHDDEQHQRALRILVVEDNHDGHDSVQKSRAVRVVSRYTGVVRIS